MTAMLIISALVIGGLILSGRAKTMGPNDWLAVAIALVGVNFLRGGSWMIGGGLIFAAAAFGGTKLLGGSKDEPEELRKPRDFELDRARSLLGVDNKADQAAINEAWRQRLAEHHPDRGGDEQLASQINRARDILLDDLEASKDQMKPASKRRR